MESFAICYPSKPFSHHPSLTTSSLSSSSLRSRFNALSYKQQQRQPSISSLSSSSQFIKSSTFSLPSLLLSRPFSHLNSNINTHKPICSSLKETSDTESSTKSSPQEAKIILLILSVSIGLIVSDIYRTLMLREDDPKIKIVILKGNGRAFCAGGDVARVISLIVLGHWSFAAAFYRKQLILDHLLATYKKPVVAIINGVVMGGGAGLSMHGRFRVTTENAMFAMPETSLGLYPDVGASHFLTRLPGFFGEYLGLTGTLIDGSDMVICGLATHLVFSKDLLSLEEALCKVESSDPITAAKVIEKFVHYPLIKQDSPWNRLDTINHCFSKNTVEEIISSLEGEVAKGGDKLLTRALVSMKRASPMSLKICLKSIRQGRKETLEECLRREYSMSGNIVRKTVNADFFEGARAMIFEKDKNPKWQPSTLELVTEEMVDRLFIEPVHDDNWVPLVFPDRRSNPVEATKSKL